MLDTSKPGGSYYLGWNDGLSGVDGTGPNSSDEITLYLANGASIDVTSNEEPSANIGVSSTTGLVVNDILMVCNAEMAAILDRKSVVSGKGVSVRVDLVGWRIIKKKTKTK